MRRVYNSFPGSSTRQTEAADRSLKTTAVMVTRDGLQPDSHYHSPGDTPETLDYERMAGVVDGVMNAVSQQPDD